ncbi:MAG: aspartate kinase [Clostridia bacterium]|nr:aspartate kinase [Clostridia bacterium]MDY5264901.1 aspartate kinase [Eubacteriales bacterium]MDY5440565.1 aspartate kinase [Eubacteriales bacterium]
MSCKVCKFGGTSMASAITVNQVYDIIESDKDRKFIVVSAPGKRDSNDIKVTDMLYKAFDEAKQTGRCDVAFGKIRERFRALADDLGLKFDLDELLDSIEKQINTSETPDYAASRGEYLSAKMFALKTGYTFIDAQDLIKFDSRGMLDAEITNDNVKRVLSGVDRAVIPGFYGIGADGEIKTFSRGGSDVTGAIIARGVNADLYENWTDVNGFMTADPRIVENPKIINRLTYKELRELSYMGANVLHPESIFPVRQAGIPINIKNTFNPSHKGTMIVEDYVPDNSVITGIAGKKDFAVLLLEKSMMNNEIGFARKVLSVLEHYGISFEHVPSGIDTMSFVISENELEDKLEKVIDGIRKNVSVDNITVYKDMALIATVGHGMAKRTGTSATLFNALAEANVNVRMIDQGSSELNIIVGVDNADYANAIKAIYKGFVG